MANSNRTYRLFVPKQAVGANLVYFDLFNAADSGTVLTVVSVQPVVSGAVAVTGILGVDLFLTHTTAVGTGGTAATRNGTDPTAATFSKLNQTQSELNGLVTARLTPSGGATAGAVVSFGSVFTEETGFSYTGTATELLSTYSDFAGLIIPAGYGIRVVQGAVASVGNIGFNIAFETK